MIGRRYPIPGVQNRRVQELRGGLVHRDFHGWGRERGWIRLNDDEQSADEMKVLRKVV